MAQTPSMRWLLSRDLEFPVPQNHSKLAGATQPHEISEGFWFLVFPNRFFC